MNVAELIPVAVEAGTAIYKWIADIIAGRHKSEAEAIASLRSSLAASISRLDNFDTDLAAHRAAADDLAALAKRESSGA